MWGRKLGLVANADDSIERNAIDVHMQKTVWPTIELNGADIVSSGEQFHSS